MNQWNLTDLSVISIPLVTVSVYTLKNNENWTDSLVDILWLHNVVQQ